MLTLRSPTVHDGPAAEALALARAKTEPVLVPLRTYADDRGWSLMNLLVGVLQGHGQINVSVQYPGVVKAWHRHEMQTDFWVCIGGHLKAGIFRETDGAAWLHVMGDQARGMLIIPPPLWHGAATVGASPATLLYYVTHAYDPNKPDEFRRAWDSVPGFPWEVRHG
jgi:dTDP-4-dehydrorhamnose 3,5-epimerase